MTRLPTRVALVVLAVPLAVTVAGVVLQLAWLGEVPATIAVHWDVAGDADGFGPAWSIPVLLAVVGLGLPALFGAILARSLSERGMTATQKVLAVAGPFAVTLIAIATTGSFAVQRGGTDPAAVPNALPLLAGGYAIALAVAVGAWFVLPRAIPGASTAGHHVPVISVLEGERVAWANTARMDRGILIALIATAALVTGLMVFVVVITGQWLFLAIPVVVALGVLSAVSWRVRADCSGLTVRSALGWPRFRVPLEDIASAGVIDVVPLGEFGGYGVRFGLGRRLGIVTRAGGALEVRRRAGRAVIVTVDDAATAAGVLTALAARPAGQG